jgi:hypothetical protein
MATATATKKKSGGAGKIRKPKMRKFPKQPKASASLQTWERYRDRVSEVEKVNCKAVADFNKAKAAKVAAEKKKAQIIKSVADRKVKCSLK